MVRKDLSWIAEKQFTPVVLNRSRWRGWGAFEKKPAKQTNSDLWSVHGVLERQNETNDHFRSELIGKFQYRFLALVRIRWAN